MNRALCKNSRGVGSSLAQAALVGAFGSAATFCICGPGMGNKGFYPVAIRC